MAARVSYRLPRYGRLNPGRKHIAGADITAKMQRQYEHILAGLRHYGRYRTDAKRKQVAAATVRKMALGNPLNTGEERAARILAREFHGRPAREIIEIEEQESYDDYGAVLGSLERLDILTEDGNHAIPIKFDFEPGSEDNILVVSDAAGKNIDFVGGDQDIPWQQIEDVATDKNLVLVGPVCEIDYFADKHHLRGPAEQKQGITYYHEFGDNGGELPYLVFDTRNTKLMLVGGDYTVEPEGITG